MIALSDRYALGFWSTNSYAIKLNIVQPSQKGQQSLKVRDASAFYSGEWAIEMFEKRIEHALNHENGLMGGTKWKDLSSVVYAFEGMTLFVLFPRRSPLTYTRTLCLQLKMNHRELSRLLHLTLPGPKSLLSDPVHDAFEPFVGLRPLKQDRIARVGIGHQSLFGRWYRTRQLARFVGDSVWFDRHRLGARLRHERSSDREPTREGQIGTPGQNDRHGRVGVDGQ